MVAQLRGKASWMVAALVALMLLPHSRLHAQGATGNVHGTVKQMGTQAPLANAEVTIAGTRLGALTRNDGSYVISGVPAGAQRVRVRLFGFAPN